MPTRGATYNLKSVTCALGGLPLGGYADDSAVEIEYISDLGESKAGGDGEFVWSKSNDQRTTVRFHLLETSPLNRLILNIWRRHERFVDAGLAVPDTEFFLEDPISGDAIASDQSFFIKMPGPTKAATASNRQWEIVLPHARVQTRLQQYDPT